MKVLIAFGMVLGMTLGMIACILIVEGIDILYIRYKEKHRK